MGIIRTAVLALRKTVIYGLFIVGLFCPLLLNGKDFTNSLFAIGFCSTAMLLDLATCWLYDRSGKRVGLDAAFLCGFIFMVIITAQLPWAYQRQKRFDKVVEAAAKLQARQAIEEKSK